MTTNRCDSLFYLLIAVICAIACSTGHSGDRGDSVATDRDTDTENGTDSVADFDDSETETSPPDSNLDSEGNWTSDSSQGSDSSADTDNNPGTDSDPDGLITFNTFFGGTRTENAFSVLQTADGGYLVSGYTHSFVIDKVEVTDEDFIITNSDILLGKFSPRGELEWKRSFGDRFPQKATSMVVAPDGGYLLAGEWTASFGKTILNIDGADVEFDKIRESAHLFKVDDDGNEDWHLIYGEAYTIEGFSKVIVTQDNHYLAVGYQVRFDEDYADEVMAPSPMPYNCQMLHYAVKTDLEGTVVWEKSFNAATSTWNQLNDVVEGPTGYMVVGSSLDIDALGRDFYVAELKKDSGDVSWEQLHPARKRFTGDDYAKAIVPIGDESAEVTGYLIAGGQDRGYDQFDREIWGSIRVIRTDTGGNKTGDWFWDVTGVYDPDKGYLKEGIDEGLDLVPTDDGKFVLLSTVAFDVFVKYYEECDVHLMKIDKNGQVDWERRYGTAKKYDMPAEIQVTKDGGFIVAGSTQSFLEPGADAEDDWHLIKTDSQGEI